MGEKFDEFSKHMVNGKTSRRGLLKLFGAGALGAAGAAAFAGPVGATPKTNQTIPYPAINAYLSPVVINAIHETAEVLKKSGFKFPWPWK